MNKTIIYFLAYSSSSVTAVLTLVELDLTEVVVVVVDVVEAVDKEVVVDDFEFCFIERKKS